MRPLFPKGVVNEIQIIATVLSGDMEIDPDIVAVNGAAAALAISDIPFNGPVAAVRVGKIDGQLVVNPTNSQLKESTLNLIVAGAPQGLVMVEAGAQMVQEEEVLEALFFAQEQLKPILELIQPHAARRSAGPNGELPEPPDNSELRQKIEALGRDTYPGGDDQAGKRGPASRHGPGEAGDSGGPGRGSGRPGKRSQGPHFGGEEKAGAERDADGAAPHRRPQLQRRPAPSPGKSAC